MSQWVAPKTVMVFAWILALNIHGTKEGVEFLFAFIEI